MRIFREKTELLDVTENNLLGYGTEERGNLWIDSTAGRSAGERLSGNQQVIDTGLEISSLQGLMMIVGTQ